jgi:phosphatidylglycerol:prolipoprotein diacylglycerol transferase
MFKFLHTFEPQRILYSLGPISIYWYGFFIVLAIVAGGLVILRLAKKQNVSEETIFDLLFWLVLGGLIGARLYDVLLELPYYMRQPLAILKVWQGGLAVHGAIVGCAVALFIFAKKRRLDFWLLTALVATAAPLAQAIGRLGNYFNQELIGRPTDLPWGIPIDIANRPLEYLSFQYFHPTFLYESLGNMIIFLILLLLINKTIKSQDSPSRMSNVFVYLILYSVLRFSLEFIKIDRTPELFGLRWPQIASLGLVVIALVGLVIINRRRTPALIDSSKNSLSS